MGTPSETNTSYGHAVNARASCDAGSQDSHNSTSCTLVRSCKVYPVSVFPLSPTPSCTLVRRATGASLLVDKPDDTRSRSCITLSPSDPQEPQRGPPHTPRHVDPRENSSDAPAA